MYSKVLGEVPGLQHWLHLEGLSSVCWGVRECVCVRVCVFFAESGHGNTRSVPGNYWLPLISMEITIPESDFMIQNSARRKERALFLTCIVTTILDSFQ